MMNPWIDVSVTIRKGMIGWPGDPPVEVGPQEATPHACEAGSLHLSLSTHTGTHMDGPLHPLQGDSIRELPLEATLGRARVLKIHDPRCVTVRELEPHRLERGERVIFKTRNSRTRWDREPFRDDYVHVSPAAARYLVGRGVRTVGTDYVSVGAVGGEGASARRTLVSGGVWLVEGLALNDVEPGDYELLCLPLKIEGAEGSPVRALLRRSS